MRHHPWERRNFRCGKHIGRRIAPLFPAVGVPRQGHKGFPNNFPWSGGDWDLPAFKAFDLDELVTEHPRFPLQIRRVLKIGGTVISECYSNHTMTGKQLPCLGITGHRGIAHVHHRVLDIRMPQPVLHERDIRAGVQQMHRNRVAQRTRSRRQMSGLMPRRTIRS